MSDPPPPKRLVLLRMAPPLAHIAEVLEMERRPDEAAPTPEEVALRRAGVVGAVLVERVKIAAFFTAGGLTEHGERIPPMDGTEPCDEYEPSGPGAGVESDGFPQCASCGYAKSAHETAPISGTVVADHLHAECHICHADPGKPCDLEIHARYARGEDS